MELVLVLVLLGVLAVVAAPRFFDLNAFFERGFFDAALNATRFAQKHAVASGCNIRIQFAATGYAVTRTATCDGTGFSVSVTDPSGGGPFADPPRGGVAVGVAELYFDSAGRPRNPSTGILLTAPTDVAIGARTLRIEPESGYAHEQ